MSPEMSPGRRGEDFDLFWDLVAADWADEHTYQSKTSRPYGALYTMADHSGLPIICDVPLCGRSWHDSDEALHELDVAQGPIPARLERAASLSD